MEKVKAEKVMVIKKEDKVQNCHENGFPHIWYFMSFWTNFAFCLFVYFRLVNIQKSNYCKIRIRVASKIEGTNRKISHMYVYIDRNEITWCKFP